MSHDPVMHAMLTSTWVLLAVPCAFIVISVLWYRQTMDERARRFEEEVTAFGRDGVEIR